MASEGDRTSGGDRGTGCEKTAEGGKQGAEKTVLRYTGLKMHNTFDIKELFSVHYFRYNKLFSVPGEKHNFWEIVYADAGTVGVIADQRAYRLEAGELIFHKPNEFHKVFTEDNVGYTVILSFSCPSPDMRFFEDRIMRPNEGEKALIGEIVREASRTFGDRLDEIYLPMMHLKDAPPLGALQKLKCLISLLLISLSRGGEVVAGTGRTNPALKSVHADELTRAVIDILTEHRSSCLTLDELSRRLYFSKTYLKTLFKAQTGESIMAYMARLRLEQAKVLLAGGASVTEAADRLGFSSVYYFSRFFKKQTGLSPTQYTASTKLENLL